MNRTTEVTSICWLRLSALGDVCNCIAPLRSLRRAYPRARLVWIIERAAIKLFRELPGIELVPFDKGAGLGGVLDLRRRLGQPRFDVLCLAQVSARANALSLMIRARRRIGFDAARAREGHALVINERIPARPMQHQAEAFNEFARLLGATPTTADRPPPIAVADREFAAAVLPEPGHAILISPCSSHPLRNWHARGYAEVADWLIDSCKRPVVLIGGPSSVERRMGQEIEAHMRHRPLNLIGKDTLGQALAMLERAACLVAPDSGPAHFAAALGTPVVGLYAATWSIRSGPAGSLEHCVDRFATAARQFRGKAPGDLRWGTRLEHPGVMALIEPAAVIEKLEALLCA